MPHTTYYGPADAVIAHLVTFVPSLPPQLQAQYTGFAAISAITVYELAIKYVLIEFSRKKHSVFGHFTQEHFDRINGRIGLKSLCNEHIPKFGEKYLNRFERLLNIEEKAVLISERASIKSSYGNLVSWRHEFAHEGQLPRNATFQEVVRSYELGKKVIDCLARSMTR
jgi:hypothetical protein